MATDHERMMLQTYAIAQARDKADRMIALEYSCAKDPEDLLQRRIYEIVACTANLAIDAMPPQRVSPSSDVFGWHSENPSRTQERIESDLFFHRPVQAQTHAICEEVALYRRGVSDQGKAEKP